MDSCPFCNLPSERIVFQNADAIAFADGYPVTDGHSIVIPRRHVIDYWGLDKAERESCHELIEMLHGEILSKDPQVTGFNIGVNAGKSAGQTVFHCHFHLIPRRDGDVAAPQGGIRNVIPGKGNYLIDVPTPKV
jgi:diadenosine tetraphosphate (Ap4A) HIT family hydrolase